MIAALLSRLERFAPLPPDVSRAMLHAPWQIRTFEPDAAIERDGVPYAGLFFIVEGSAFGHKSTKSDKRQILSLKTIGDFIGLHGFLFGHTDHSVTALSPVRAVFLPHEATLDLITTHPQIALALWREMAVESAQTREWMIGIGRRSAHGRVAHFLCEIGIKLNAAGVANGDACEFVFTQTELGDALGISTVHVNRVLQQLRREGLIALHGTSLQIKDWKGLTEVAEFQVGYLHMNPEDKRKYVPMRENSEVSLSQP